MITETNSTKNSQSTFFADDSFDRSIKIIDLIPNLRFKDLGCDLLTFWCHGGILSAQQKFLYSEQWSIFLYAFKQFERGHISKKSNIHFMVLIELGRYWEKHLIDINSEIMRGGWPEEIEIFQFEKWIDQITSDDPWKNSLNRLRIEYDTKGKMIIR